MKNLTPHDVILELMDLFGCHVKVISSTDDGLIQSATGMLQKSTYIEDAKTGLRMEMFSIANPYYPEFFSVFGFSMDNIQHAYVDSGTLCIESGCGFIQVSTCPAPK